MEYIFMFDADHKRLQRERDIAVSVAPPNYSRLEKDIRAVKAEAGKRERSANEYFAQQRAGYYDAVARGEIQRIDGQVPVIRR